MNTARMTPWIAAWACVALAGCQTQKQTATLQCAGGGFAAGYLLCKAMGRPDSECLKFSTVVAAGGAAICYSYAANLERRRKELAGHENDLNRRIQYVRGLNQDSEQLNAELSKRVAATTQRTDTLVAQIRQRQISQEQLAKERKALADEVDAANAQATLSRDALKEVKAYRAQQKQPSPELDTATAKYEQTVNETQAQVELLAAQRARV